MAFAVQEAPYQPLLGEPLPGEPSAPIAEEEGSSLQFIIEKTEALSHAILQANDECVGLDTSYEYYKTMSGGWELVESSLLKALSTLKTLDAKREHLIIQRNVIVNEFCNYDSTHLVTKKSNPQADRFKELIKTINTTLESFKRKIPEVQKKYLEAIKHLGVSTSKEADKRDYARILDEQVEIGRELRRVEREIKSNIKKSQQCCCVLV